jgi:hypothetical protein
MLSNKLYMQHVPIFNNFQILRDGFQVTPFIHFNLLFTPEFAQTSLKDHSPLHLSSGFGLNFLTEGISVELYYNAYIKKNSKDIGQEFSVSFGID